MKPCISIIWLMFKNLEPDTNSTFCAIVYKLRYRLTHLIGTLRCAETLMPSWHQRDACYSTTEFTLLSSRLSIRCGLLHLPLLHFPSVIYSFSSPAFSTAAFSAAPPSAVEQVFDILSLCLHPSRSALIFIPDSRI